MRGVGEVAEGGRAVNELTKEFFDNRAEQAKIKLAITEAIPPGVFYHNLCIAVAELLRNYVADSYKDDVFTKWHNEG